ncbi:MAG: Asp-tRNA(Asn)/Glu-tRNA(Gln) amidotransferase subunit GatA [Firmicutes bacterium]|nr:Asp-tRNA(Asn)/Glu-tRNA(Gln) amidotransferase subunit GatA [Bacillota bacterium]
MFLYPVIEEEVFAIYAHLSARELAVEVKKNEGFREKMAAALLQKCSSAQKEYDLFSSWYGEKIAQKYKEVISEKASSDKKLLGVPYVLDDTICSLAFPAACGSPMLQNYRPPFEAYAVSLLSRAGAFLCGKARVAEFGLGCLEESPLGAVTANPRGKGHIAGSGAAAAVASGAVSFALGVDTTGELREAASYCGIFALKPSYGAISRRGLIGFSPSLEQAGILASRSSDLALVFQEIAVRDPQDATSRETFSFSPQGDQAKIRKIAVPKDWSSVPSLHEEVKKVFADKLEQLTAMGFELDYISLPHFFYAPAAGSLLAAVEAFSSLANYDGVRFGCREEGRHLQEMYTKTRSRGFGKRSSNFIIFGALVSSGKYYDKYFVQAQKLRTLIKRELLACLLEYDCLLTPTVPFTAPLLGRKASDHGGLNFVEASYTMAANLAGLPALSYPVLSEGSLPLGLQFIGRDKGEADLIEIASFLKKENF